MDSRLRILERQAITSGTSEDWKKYAQSLEKALFGSEIENDISVWIAKIHLDRVGETLIAVFATEAEARGHILNSILDDLGEIIYDIDMDEAWYNKHQKFVKTVELGNYNEAWLMWNEPGCLSKETCDGGGRWGAWDSYEIEHLCIASCGPKVPPTHQTIRI